MKKLTAFLILSAMAIAKPTVATSILPTAYFVKQIAGDTLNVVTLIEPGADPHTYEPKPAQAKELAKSDLYFGVGVELEKAWLNKFKDSFPQLKIINTQDGIELIKFSEHHEHEHEHDADEPEHLEKHDHHAHEHEHEHHHDHDGLDPHVWLDPILVKTQALNIEKALLKKYPENTKLYEKNLAKFEKELDKLDEQIKQTLKDIKNNKFIVYHPSWGYFAKRYNLEQIAIEVEGKEPSLNELKELIEEAKEEKVKAIFVAPAFSKKSAELIAKQTGASVVEIDPLSANWYQSILDTAKALKAGLAN